MRDIKFKLYDINLNDFYTEFAITEDGKILLNVIGDEWCLVNPDNFKILQYTGLKDKNGKEIYEGDSVETPFRTTGFNIGFRGDDEIYTGFYRGVVHYQASRGFFQKNVVMLGDEDESGLWTKRSDLSNIIQSRCEIIGNIYENPELA